MPKNYSIRWTIDDTQARGVFRRGNSEMEALERRVLKTAGSIEQMHQRVAASFGRNYAAQGQAAHAAAAVAVRATTKKVTDIEAIELRWSVRDYKSRVRAERDKQRLDDFARARHAKAIKDRETLELAWLAREYKERVAHERRKEALAERAARKQARDAEIEAKAVAAAEKRLAESTLRARVKDAAAREALRQRENDAAKQAAKKQADQAIAEERRRAEINLRNRVKEAADREALTERQVQKARRDAARAEAAALGPNGRLAQVQRRSLTEEQLQLAARNRAYDVAHQKRIRQILDEQYATKSAFEDAIGNAFGIDSSLTKAGVAAAAVVGALKGLSSIRDLSNEIRQNIEKAAEATLDMRRQLRPESILKGAERADNKTLAEALRFRAATGLNETEASDLTRQFLGSLPAGLQKGNITQDVADRLMTQVGIMQARQGGAASTRGDLAGLLAQFGPIKSVEAGLGQMEAIRLALTAGRGDDTPLTNQLLKTAGSMVREGGPVGTLAEQAALIGVTSLSAGPEEAGTRAEQISRALRAGLTKQGKAKGAAMPQAAYLKSIGITETDSLESALTKLAADVNQAQASGRAPDVYLAERGFRAEEERRALVSVIPDIKILQERLRLARGAESGTGALAANQRFLASEQGQNAVAEQLGAAKTATIGLQAERWVAMKKAAEASPEVVAGDQSVTTSVLDYFRGLAVGETPFLGDPAKAGRETRISGIAMDAMRKRAKALGVTDDQLLKAQRESYSAGPGFEAAYASRVQGLIAQRGGTNAVDIEPTMKRLADAMEENNRLLSGQKGNGKNLAPVMLPVNTAPGRPGR